MLVHCSHVRAGESRAPVTDVKFAPRHCGLKLVLMLWLGDTADVASGDVLRRWVCTHLRSNGYHEPFQLVTNGTLSLKVKQLLILV